MSSNPTISEVVFVVRHARAGVRTDHADDHLRPLDAVGRLEARAIARWFGSAEVGDIVSSPFVRCVETLQPLARRRGRSVVTTDVLAEGNEMRIDRVVQLIADVPARSVLCTHGDIVTALADHLEFADDLRDHPDRFAKGVVWVLRRGGDRSSVVELARPIRPPVHAAAGRSAGAAHRPAPAMTSTQSDRGAE